MGSWGERCPDGKTCGKNDCPKCSPTAILPSHLRGKKKQGGSKPSAASGKYIVKLVGYSDRALGTDEYMTCDAAVMAAKKLRRSSMVFRGLEIIADVSASGMVTFR